VERWTRRSRINVTRLDLVIVPVHAWASHWVLSGVDIAYRLFFYLDSLRGRDTGGVVDKLKAWILDEVKNKTGENASKSFDVHRWPTDVNGDVSLQTDTAIFDVFVVLLADCLILGAAAAFTQADMNNMRLRMAGDLVCGTINANASCVGTCCRGQYGRR